MCLLRRGAGVVARVVVLYLRRRSRSFVRAARKACTSTPTTTTPTATVCGCFMPIYAIHRALLIPKPLHGFQRLSRSCKGSIVRSPLGLGTIPCSRALSSTVQVTAGGRSHSLSDIQEDVRAMYEACKSLEGETSFGMPDVVEAGSRLSKHPRDVVRIAGMSVTIASPEYTSIISKCVVQMVPAATWCLRYSMIPCHQMLLFEQRSSTDGRLTKRTRQTSCFRSKILQIFDSRPSHNQLSRQSNISSSFFTRFQDHGIELEICEVEVALDVFRPTQTFADIACSDIPIIVVSLQDISDSALRFLNRHEGTFRHNPNSLLVLDGPFHPDSPTVDKLKEDFAKSYGIEMSRTIVCDSSRALRGGSSLARDASSASAVSLFQQDVSVSNISRVVDHIAKAITLGPVTLRGNAAQALLKTTILDCGRTVEQTKDEIVDLRDDADKLLSQVLEEREKAICAILGSDSDVASREEKSQIEIGMGRVKKDVEPVLDGLSWTKLPFVIDDVSTRVDGAVERALARQFGNEVGTSTSSK